MSTPAEPGRADVSRLTLRAEPAWPARALIGLVRGYRFFLSPWLGSACRFEPTCSVYALQALQERGAADGAYLTLRRLLRCHPLCAGGFDPVPQPPLRRRADCGAAALHRRASLSSTSTDKTSS